MPIGVNSKVENEELILIGMVASLDGKKLIRDSKRGDIKDSESIGIKLANELKSQGAMEILQEIFKTMRPES